MDKPKIRFKGYTEAWEQRKLGDVYNFQYGEFNNNPDNGGEYPIYGANGIIGGYTKYNAEDSAIIGHMGAYAGYVVWASGKHFVTYNGTIARPLDDSLDSKFGYCILSQKRIYRICAGSGQPFVSYADLNGIDIEIPTEKSEQEKIGAYFTNLDHLITLHQRKCDETKKLKKYMLQKMFPQNDEKIPEIRFSGFTEAWEQRKLSEIAAETYGGGTPKTSNEEFWKGNIPWIQSSDLIDECLFDVKPRKCISQEAVSKSATKLVPQNSITIVTRVGVGKLAFMPFSYATSQDFLSLSGLKTDPEFTVYALYKMMQLVSNEVQGTSIKGVTKDELLTKKIMIPCCNEQKKIGAYLHDLDHLITLHQHKCDELQKLKKFMLQNMFV